MGISQAKMAVVASQLQSQAASRRPGQLASAITTLSLISRRLFKERLADEPWVAEAGLRAPCYSVLTWIERLEPVSQKRVSDQIAHDPSDIVDRRRHPRARRIRRPAARPRRSPPVLAESHAGRKRRVAPPRHDRGRGAGRRAGTSRPVRARDVRAPRARRDRPPHRRRRGALTRCRLRSVRSDPTRSTRTIPTTGIGTKRRDRGSGCRYGSGSRH